MFSCDYNGWADVPEEEREGIDAFEGAGPPSAASVTIPPIVERAVQQLLPVRSSAGGVLIHRKAA